MKNFLLLMAFSLLLIACKSKRITTHQQEQKTELAERLIQQEESMQRNSVSSEEIQLEIKELQEFISNLNVSFDGKGIDDKLDILLKKTNDGTRLTFQGKGNVNYSESIKYEIESLKNEVLKRQDSIFTTLNVKLSNLELKIAHYLKTKDKEVKVRGFTFGIYFYIGIAIAVILVLFYLKKKFL